MCLRNRPQPPIKRSDEGDPVFEYAPWLSRFHQIQDAVSPALFHFSGDSSREVALSENEDIFDTKGFMRMVLYSGSEW